MPPRHRRPWPSARPESRADGATEARIASAPPSGSPATGPVRALRSALPAPPPGEAPQRPRSGPGHGRAGPRADAARMRQEAPPKHARAPPHPAAPTGKSMGQFTLRSRRGRILAGLVSLEQPHGPPKRSSRLQPISRRGPSLGPGPAAPSAACRSRRPRSTPTAATWQGRIPWKTPQVPAVGCSRISRRSTCRGSADT